MASIVLTIPITTGKAEAWRRFCQELAGSRRQMYVASRLRLGIKSERLALVETVFSSTTVIILEAPDIGRALGQMVVSELPFDALYRDRLQELHGVTLASYEHFSQAPLPAHEPEVLFEWRLSASPGYARPEANAHYL